MRAPVVRWITFVAVASSVLLVARPGSAQVASPAPACCTPISPPQTVSNPPPASTAAVGVGYSHPTAVTTYYVAPVLSPPHVVQYYPQYEIREGPILGFIRQLLEPLAAVGGFAPPRPVAAAQPVALAPGFSAPGFAAAAPPDVPVKELKPPLMTTYGTPSSYSPVVLPGTTYAASPPPATVLHVAPSSGTGLTYAGSPLGGVPTPTVQPSRSGHPVSAAPPDEDSSYEGTVRPNVRIDYDKKRKDLPNNPSTSVREPRSEIMPAAHRRDAQNAPSGEAAMNQPRAAGSDPPDASGWRSVP